MYQEELELDIYIDGSSIDHPRRGGIGIVYVWTNVCGCIDFYGPKYSGWIGASNNMMELKAAETAFKDVFQYRSRDMVKKITIHSDSNYVVLPVNDNRLLYTWPSNGWTGGGKFIEHQKMWESLRNQLIRMMNMKISFNFKKVEAHSGNKFNELADIYAFWSREHATNPPLELVQVYGKTISKNKRGKFIPENQTVNIRIYEGHGMKIAKCYRYSFEVYSEESKYYSFSGKADSNRSDLENGHYYIVRFNDVKNAPRIVEVVSELDKETMLPMSQDNS